MKQLFAFVMVLLLSISPLKAAMQDALETAFGALGMANNVTTGGGYQDQTGGYYTGGSVFARSKVHNADLLSLQLPHYRSGCGGIDLFMGGFSFINGAEFLHLLRNIGSNAQGFAFNLALATVTPQIKSVIDELAAKVQQYTSQSVNSCEAAATLVGGIWPQTDASSQLLCNAMGTELGVATDWGQSRQKCGAEGRREVVNARKDTLPAFVDVLGDEFNLAWKAIQKNAFLRADGQLAEFFMSISGTLVSRRVRNHIHLAVLPSKSTDHRLMTALIKGTVPAQIYRCDDRDENRCLNPDTQNITLGAAHSFEGKVSRFLQSISQKVVTDTALSNPEKAFVNSTMIPVLKIMAVESAFKAGGSPLSIAHFSETIAYDILLHYLDEVMSLVLDSVSQLKKSQISDKLIEEFRAGVSESRKLLYVKRTALFEQMSATLDLIERTHQIETKLQNMFISQQIKAGGK